MVYMFLPESCTSATVHGSCIWWITWHEKLSEMNLIVFSTHANWVRLLRPSNRMTSGKQNLKFSATYLTTWFSSWWLNQPTWKMCVRQIGNHFPQNRGENFKKMKPPTLAFLTWCFQSHHLKSNGLSVIRPHLLSLLCARNEVITRGFNKWMDNGLEETRFADEEPSSIGWNIDLGVSKNSGTPKWMVYNGKPY